jgi:isocitrate/isopropylmalate dehydrogenase
MMLEALGETGAAFDVEQAVEAALVEGSIVLARDGRCISGTREAALAVAERLF